MEVQCTDLLCHVMLLCIVFNYNNNNNRRGKEEKHMLKIPFLEEGLKNHKNRWCRMNKNEFRDSSFLSWTWIKCGNKAVIDRGLSVFPSLWVPFVFTHRSYPGHDKTQLFVPPLPSLKSRNLVMAGKACAFVIADFGLFYRKVER